MYKYWILGLWMGASALLAQTQVDLSTQSKNVDFSQAASTRPVKMGSSLPSTCTTGELFYLSTAAAGQNLYACTNANTWTMEAGGGGGTRFASQMTDLQLTLTGNTVLTIGATCAPVTPCNVLVNGFVIQFTSPATVTNSAGTALTARVYVSDGSDGNTPGTLAVANSAASGLTCSGCTVMNSMASFPATAVPLGMWSAASVAGEWDATGGTDYRGWLGGGTRLVSGNGNCSITTATSGTTLTCSGITPSARGAFSAVPSCDGSIAGQIYYASSSSGLSAQCDGTAWQWYANGDQISIPPAAAIYTAVNSAVVTDANGSVTISAASGTDSNLRSALISGGTAMTFTIGYKANNSDGTGPAACGLIVSDGTANNSKYMLWGDAGNGPSEYYYASGYAGGVTSSFTSTPSPYMLNLGGIHWRRLAISGGTINYYSSPDGQNWVADSHSNTVVGTFSPAFYGFGCDPRGGSETYGAVIVSLHAQ